MVTIKICVGYNCNQQKFYDGLVEIAQNVLIAACRYKGWEDDYQLTIDQLIKLSIIYKI